MKHEDYDRFPGRFQTKGEQKHLEGNRGKEEEIVTVEKIERVPEAGDENHRQQETTKDTGGGLFDAEEPEFMQERFQWCYLELFFGWVTTTKGTKDTKFFCYRETSA
jgi:hypothetical protein